MKGTLGIVGCGVMGRQIAAFFKLGGFAVHLWNRSPVDARLLGREEKLLARTMELTADPGGEFIIHSRLEDLPAGVVLESVVEDLEVKRQLIERLRSLPGTYCLLSNSSSYAPGEIGDNIHGLHFFNPLSVRLVEVCLRNPDGAATLQPILEFLETCGFAILDVHDHRGYLANRILFHEIGSALAMVEKHRYSPGQVADVYARLMPGRDIFSLVDRIGVDVTLRILENLHAADEGIYVPDCLRQAMAAGTLGRKNRTSIRQFLEGEGVK